MQVIDPVLYGAFAAAVTVLMLIPGPNVALIVGTSLRNGRRAGFLTVAGTSAAMVVQLILTAIGMTAALTALADSFAWLRWIGVLYLLWLGIRQWQAPPIDLSQVRPPPKADRAIVLRGFAVSLTNPKTLFFYGAFFPQFVSADLPVLPQLVLLSATFLLIALTVDSLWVLLASRVRGLLAARPRLRNRLAGGALIGAGVGLALARRT